MPRPPSPSPTDGTPDLCHCRVSEIAQGGASIVYGVLEASSVAVSTDCVIKILKPQHRTLVDQYRALVETLSLQSAVRRCVTKSSLARVPRPFSIVLATFLTEDNVQLRTLIDIDDTKEVGDHLRSSLSSVDLRHIGPRDRLGHVEERVYFVCEVKPKSPFPFSIKYEETRFVFRRSQATNYDFRDFASELFAENLAGLKIELRTMWHQQRLHLKHRELLEDSEDVEEVLESLAVALIQHKAIILWIYKHVVLCEGVPTTAKQIWDELSDSDKNLFQLDRFMLPLDGGANALGHLAPGLCTLEDCIVERQQQADDVAPLVSVMEMNERLANDLMMEGSCSPLEARKSFLGRFFLARIFSDVSLLFDAAYRCFLIDFDTSKGHRKIHKWAHEFTEQCLQHHDYESRDQ